MHKNPYRELVCKYAKKRDICTQCFARKTDGIHNQCKYCTEKKNQQKIKSRRAISHTKRYLRQKGYDDKSRKNKVMVAIAANQKLEQQLQELDKHDKT